MIPPLQMWVRPVAVVRELDGITKWVLLRPVGVGST